MNPILLQNPRFQPWKILPFVVLILMLWAFQSSAQTLSCSALSPFVPPEFPVGETHSEDGQSFWQNGGHVPENVVDEDLTNYARAHIKQTGYASIRVGIYDSTVVYDAGFFVGFYIQSQNFDDGNFDGVTISTYLNGSLQESYSGSQLLTSEAVGNNDTIVIGFITTLPYNQVEVTLSAEGGMALYDVFYAVQGICLSEILPVSWLSFEAQKKGEASAALTWTTAQEINNAGFYVERSADGRHFESIGFVAADDQSRNIMEYSFLDPKPFGGLNYYRIRQMDHDGGIGYSPVRTLSFTGKGISLRLWPNPAAENLFVEIPGQDDAGGEIKLISSSGVVVWSQSYDDFAPQTKIDTRTLETGMYYIIIESMGNTHNEKIMILK